MHPRRHYKHTHAGRVCCSEPARTQREPHRRERVRQDRERLQLDLLRRGPEQLLRQATCGACAPPPLPVATTPKTRCPGAKRDTPVPRASTTPARSLPRLVEKWLRLSGRASVGRSRMRAWRRSGSRRSPARARAPARPPDGAPRAFALPAAAAWPAACRPVHDTWIVLNGRQAGRAQRRRARRA